MPRSKVRQPTEPAEGGGERISAWLAARDHRWAAMLFNAAQIIRGNIRDPEDRVRHSVREAGLLMAELAKPHVEYTGEPVAAEKGPAEP